MPKKTIILIGTYVPWRGGIATFTKDTYDALNKISGQNINLEVVAVNISSPLNYPEEVKYQISKNNKNDYIKLAHKLNIRKDILCIIIQHEYGIFGGKYGSYILNFLKYISPPVFTVCHTTLADPGYEMKQITQNILERSRACIVLTNNSRDLLTMLYKVERNNVHVIPHGVHPIIYTTPQKAKKKFNLENYHVLTTFGLLSKSKGIEYMIHAVSDVVKTYPNIKYYIIGATHPVVLENEGEKYRNSLTNLIRKLNLQDNIVMVNDYLNLEELIERLKATDIYISTSTNPEQAVSGTFSYAIGTGRATISTEFIQAKEEIRKSTGRLVPTNDSKAFADSIRDLLGNNKLNKMHRNAFRKTRRMLYTNVAYMTLDVIKNSLSNKKKVNVFLPKLNLKHLEKLTTDFGIVQFSKYTKPDKNSGYTLDDNARALLAVSWIYKDVKDDSVLKLIKTYLRFIEYAVNHKKIVNYLTYEKIVSDQNYVEDIEDSFARCFWVLCEISSNHNLPNSIKERAYKLILNNNFDNSLSNHLRPKAFIIKGYYLLKTMNKINKKQMNRLKKFSKILNNAFIDNSTNTWKWFEDTMSYAPALLPEALLFGGVCLNKKEYFATANNAVHFMISKTFHNEVYSAIGQKKWYTKHRVTPSFDQQPEDPAQTVISLINFYNLTEEYEYLYLAKKAFSWFLGNNILSKRMIDDKTGGVYDGLTKHGVNENMGAESLISYLLAREKIKNYL
jgi:glycosyltransferase involved in cell wall biosynthesis